MIDALIVARGYNMIIKLYTLPTCGICKIIKKKFQNKNISYEELNLEQYSNILNTDHAPVLQVDDKFYFTPARINDWINNQ